MSGSLYVWGSNEHAELCVSEDDITKTKLYNHEQSIIYGPMKVKSFSNQAIDISSSDGLTLITLNSAKNMNLIQAGVAFDLDPLDQPIVHTEEELKNVFYALPFLVSISEQVTKVSCGVHFGMILSVSGKVYTLGTNIYGQLGQGRSEYNKAAMGQEILAVKRPLIVKDLTFDDDFIIDIAAGFTHCLALSSKQKVYIWGQ